MPGRSRDLPTDRASRQAKSSKASAVQPSRELRSAADDREELILRVARPLFLALGIGSSWLIGKAVVHFDGEALTKFETLKRESKATKGQRGTCLFPHANFLVVDKVIAGQDPIGWQDFYGVVVASAYRESGSAEFKLAVANTVEQLTTRESAEADDTKLKYLSKLEAANRKIATADDLHARCPDEDAKAALLAQVNSARAVRDALLAKQGAVVEAVHEKYSRIKVTRSAMDQRIARRKARAEAKAAELHTRQAAAGGAQQADGAAAIADVVTSTPVAARQPASPTVGFADLEEVDLAIKSELHLWVDDYPDDAAGNEKLDKVLTKAHKTTHKDLIAKLAISTLSAMVMEVTFSGRVVACVRALVAKDVASPATREQPGAGRPPPPPQAAMIDDVVLAEF